jgi:CBS domain-containing protein
MVDRGVGSVVLLEHDVLRGIVTYADVVKHIAAGGETTQRVRTQLSDELLTVNEDTVAADAAELMKRHGVHHLLVVDWDGVFKGLISSWDLTAEMVKDAQAFPYNREWIESVRTQA